MSNKVMEDAKQRGFGVEMEYTHISREKAAKAIHSVVGGQIRYAGGSYDAWEVTDLATNRIWKCVSDASLGDRATTCEVVSPILKWDDFETLQEVVRALRKAKAKATPETAVHIHVDVRDFTGKQLANLARIHYKQEELILKAVGTWEHRLNTYCKRTDKAFIERLEKSKPKTNIDLNKAWFGYENLNPSHYENHRYATLNLNNIWRIGTAEWRCFNGTLHSCEIKCYAMLSLTLASLAKNAKAATSKNQRPYSEQSARYDFRCTLLRLGFIGNEFKNVRMHLLKRLPGSSAWKRGSRDA